MTGEPVLSLVVSLAEQDNDEYDKSRYKRDEIGSGLGRSRSRSPSGLS